LSQLPNVIPGPGAVRLPDGRSLTFAAAGPEDGFPVVYCHGAIGSPRWRTPGLDDVIEELSIRYLVVNRPGFGGSDPCPGRTVADFALDLGHVMTVLGHRRFSVVGVSAGAPYALACGWALPERIVSLAAVSPLGPPTGAGSRSSLRYRVPLAAFGLPRGGPILAGTCLRALRLKRQTSAEAMIGDYLVCRSHWGFEPAQLTVPVTVWHGATDRLVPLSHAFELADAIPTCTAVVDRTGGHFFYSRRLAEIAGSLLPELAIERDDEPVPLPRAA
jgi:pimeloyl-ACP methyl ester carboxylesterase